MDEPVRELTEQEKAEREAAEIFGECSATGRAHAFCWVWGPNNVWMPLRKCMNCGDEQECGV